jgi:hypothetical protein
MPAPDASQRALEINDKFDFATFIGSTESESDTTTLEQETAKLAVDKQELSVEEEIKRAFYNLGGPNDINKTQHAGPSS